MQKVQETCDTLVEKYERPRVVTYGEHDDDLVPGLTCTNVQCQPGGPGHVISWTDP